MTTFGISTGFTFNATSVAPPTVQLFPPSNLTCNSHCQATTTIISSVAADTTGDVDVKIEYMEKNVDDIFNKFIDKVHELRSKAYPLGQRLAKKGYKNYKKYSQVTKTKKKKRNSFKKGAKKVLYRQGGKEGDGTNLMSAHMSAAEDAGFDLTNTTQVPGDLELWDYDFGPDDFDFELDVESDTVQAEFIFDHAELLFIISHYIGYELYMNDLEAEESACNFLPVVSPIWWWTALNFFMCVSAWVQSLVLAPSMSALMILMACIVGLIFGWPEWKNDIPPDMDSFEFPLAFKLFVRRILEKFDTVASAFGLNLNTEQKPTELEKRDSKFRYKYSVKPGGIMGRATRLSKVSIGLEYNDDEMLKLRLLVVPIHSDQDDPKTKYPRMLSLLFPNQVDKNARFLISMDLNIAQMLQNWEIFKFNRLGKYLIINSLKLTKSTMKDFFKLGINVDPAKHFFRIGEIINNYHSSIQAGGFFGPHLELFD